MSAEVEFAKGKEISNQRIRVTYENMNPMEPNSKFTKIYKTHGDDSVTTLTLTPDEGIFLTGVLGEMFKK